RPFSGIMHAQTGVRGELIPAGDMEALASQMSADKMQLGVFHGIEFAWARVKYPQLKPLAIAINQERHLRASLVVRNDCQGAGVDCLQDKAVAVPEFSKLHCTLFVDKCCRTCRQRSNKGVAKITNPSNAEDALDDVVDGDVAAAVVDNM